MSRSKNFLSEALMYAEMNSMMSYNSSRVYSKTILTKKQKKARAKSKAAKKHKK
jgi:hypothetical protein